MYVIVDLLKDVDAETGFNPTIVALYQFAREIVPHGMLVVSMANLIWLNGFPSFILGIFILDCLNLKIVQFS